MNDLNYLSLLITELVEYERADIMPPTWLYQEVSRMRALVYGSTEVPEPEWEPIDNVIRDMSCKHINTIEDWYGSRWFADEVYDDHYSVLRCADCGFIFDRKDEDGENL